MKLLAPVTLITSLATLSSAWTVAFYKNQCNDSVSPGWVNSSGPRGCTAVGGADCMNGRIDAAGNRNMKICGYHNKACSGAWKTSLSASSDEHAIIYADGKIRDINEVTMSKSEVCTYCSLAVCNRNRYLALSYKFESKVDLHWFADEFNKVATNNICQVRRYVITTNPHHPSQKFVIADIARVPEGNPAENFVVSDGKQGTVFGSAAWHLTCADALAVIKVEIGDMRKVGLPPVVKVLSADVTTFEALMLHLR
ncbi:hypothetical protein BJY00DRAFT_314647 [Aspergillus carlsbadensis]|nr:hypothetical protein BJY00DRAFT_314647 [Aspergillus carlsbadensis]